MSNFISVKAKLEKDIALDKNIIIEDAVTIGDNCHKGYNVIIKKVRQFAKKIFNYFNNIYLFKVDKKLI